VASGEYPLARAAADLAAAGLLHGCLEAREGRWHPLPPRGELHLPGGFRGATLDSREVAGGQLFVGLAGERSDGRSFVSAALAAGAAAALTRAWTGPGADPLLSEAAAGARPALVLLCADPVAALGRLAGRWREMNRQVALAAVTGSNGKTTTKDLIAAALRAAGSGHATRGNLNNALGLPLTVLGLRAEHRYAVLEMGASAAGEIALLAGIARPDVGVITNAAEAHLAEFGSLAGVIRGKGELLDALPQSGLAVLNAGSPGFAEWRRRARCPVVTFGREAADHRWSWRPDAAGTGGELELDGQTWPLPLPGEHNGANLVAAILAVRGLGLPDACLRDGLARHFRPSEHRGRWEEMSGIRVLDDSYNANPVSMRSAVAALCAGAGGRRFAALGRMAELGNGSEELHRRTGVDLFASGLDVLVSVGEGAEALGRGFREAGGEAHHCVTREEAAAWLAAHAVPGDRVLLKGSRVARMEDVVHRLRELVASRTD